jgi:transposase-like protein
MPNISYSEEFKKKIVELYDEKKSLRRVAELTGIGRNTIAAWVRQRQEETNTRSNAAAQPIAVAVSQAMREIAREQLDDSTATSELQTLQQEKEELARRAASLLKKRITLAENMTAEEGMHLISNRDLITLAKDLIPPPRETTGEETGEQPATLFDAYAATALDVPN